MTPHCRLCCSMGRLVLIPHRLKPPSSLPYNTFLHCCQEHRQIGNRCAATDVRDAPWMMFSLASQPTRQKILLYVAKRCSMRMYSHQIHKHTRAHKSEEARERARAESSCRSCPAQNPAHLLLLFMCACTSCATTTDDTHISSTAIAYAIFCRAENAEIRSQTSSGEVVERLLEGNYPLFAANMLALWQTFQPLTCAVIRLSCFDEIPYTNTNSVRRDTMFLDEATDNMFVHICGSSTNTVFDQRQPEYNPYVRSLCQWYVFLNGHSDFPGVSFPLRAARSIQTTTQTCSHSHMNAIHIPTNVLRSQRNATRIA